MKHKFLFGALLVGALSVGFGASVAFAQVWIFANGGSYYTQYGSTSDWYKVSNDGYCISGRGPCGSTLWYYKWTHGSPNACASVQYAEWDWYGSSAVKLYPGDTYAWIDNSSGTVELAYYTVNYNYGSGKSLRRAQSSYSEAWMPLGTDLYRTTGVWLWDEGWGCSPEPNEEVEYDEIKLEI